MAEAEEEVRWKWLAETAQKPFPGLGDQFDSYSSYWRFLWSTIRDCASEAVLGVVSSQENEEITGKSQLH